VPKGDDEFPCATRQALLSLAAGCNIGSLSDGSGRGGAGGFQSQLSLTDLVIQLLMRLWDLLADPAIMGTSMCPAGWLPYKGTYLEWSRQCIVRMVTAVQDALAAAGSTSPLSAGAPAPRQQPASRPASGQMQGVVGGGQIQGNSSGGGGRGVDQSASSSGAAALTAQGCDSSGSGHGAQPPLTSASHLAGYADATAQLVGALRPRVPWDTVCAALCATSRAGAPARLGERPLLYLSEVYCAVQHTGG
jgi:hypothetical protein